MITAELTKKINLLPQESYRKVENFVEQLIDADNRKDYAFRTFIKKMDAAENSVREHGGYSEEEAEEELAKI
ncbi:MAG: hypothetical protein NC400_06220 [Clostridium sp.]|nr:hypothetical protein [Clostridium sp.]